MYTSDTRCTPTEVVLTNSISCSSSIHVCCQLTWELAFHEKHFRIASNDFGTKRQERAIFSSRTTLLFVLMKLAQMTRWLRIIQHVEFEGELNVMVFFFIYNYIHRACIYFRNRFAGSDHNNSRYREDSEWLWGNDKRGDTRKAKGYARFN